MKPFSKTTEIGTMKRHPNRHVYIKIEYNEKGNLSITGDISSISGKQCWAAGQINMSIQPDDIDPAPNWNTVKIAHLFTLWDKWHLNDMHPECEHQRENWDLKKELQIPVYTWTPLYCKARNRAANGEMTTDEYTMFSAMTKKVDKITIKQTYDAELATLLVDAGLIRLEKTKKQAAHWTTQNEHPEGLLSKPCEVCGYKYGSKWNFVPVPEEILEWFWRNFE